MTLVDDAGFTINEAISTDAINTTVIILRRFIVYSCLNQKVMFALKTSIHR